MFLLFLLFLVFFIGLALGLVIVVKSIKANATSAEISAGVIYVISLLVFFVGMFGHSAEYFTAIDPIETCYTPFSGGHFITLLFYFAGFHVSAVLIWTRMHRLPPLAIMVCAVFLLIGIVLGLVCLVHVSGHDRTSLNMYDAADSAPFWFAPFCMALIGIRLLYLIVRKRIGTSEAYIYANPFLHVLNGFLAKRIHNLFWIVVFLLPIYLLATLILLVFGQDPDSIAKVFADTATWKLSQRAHPPVLGHQGHYLCTVAVAGNPGIVKPLRFGTRHGKTIIVNRQLLVANAFEELLQDLSPRMHRIVRNIYDKYGLDLSQRINTVYWSNMTYILMKPLEWSFVVCLYLFCKDPERKINRQYGG